MLPELEARVARGELSLRGVNPTALEVDEALLAQRQHADRPHRGAGRALDDAAAIVRRSRGTRSRCRDLATDFWSTALWAARKLRRGEVFTAVDCRERLAEAVAGDAAELARAVPSTSRRHVRDAGVVLERWADAGALAALETRLRALRPARRRACALGDDRPLPGPRGGDRTATRARWPRSITPSASTHLRRRPRSAARSYPLTVRRLCSLLLVATRSSWRAAAETTRRPTPTTTAALTASVRSTCSATARCGRQLASSQRRECRAAAMAELYAGPTRGGG